MAEATDQIQIIVESVAEAAALSAMPKRSTETTFAVNDPLVQAVRIAVSKAAPDETAEMVTAFREVAEGGGSMAAKVR